MLSSILFINLFFILHDRSFKPLCWSDSCYLLYTHINSVVCIQIWRLPVTLSQQIRYRLPCETILWQIGRPLEIDIPPGKHATSFQRLDVNNVVTTLKRRHVLNGLFSIPRNGKTKMLKIIVVLGILRLLIYEFILIQYKLSLWKSVWNMPNDTDFTLFFLFPRV